MPGPAAQGAEKPGRGDQAREGDIDFVGIRTTAEQRQRGLAQAREITGGQLWQTCESIVVLVEALKQSNTNRLSRGVPRDARGDSDQPAVQKLRDAGCWDQVDLMLLPEDEFVSLNPGFAYLLRLLQEENT